MSDVSSYPRQSYFRATLQSPISAVQTSGIILSEQLQAISGTIYLNLLDPNNVETISCTGQGVTGELTGVTRAVATYSGETATAYAHGAGITIVLSDDWNYWQDMVTGLNDKVNIGGDTMTGLLQFSGAANPGIKMNNLTTVQRDALSAANGEVIYNTTTSELNVYQGGAWVAIASGSTQPNGSTTVAGKYQEATVAQQLAATATGSTGARLVPVTANMVSTSAGAGDAGKIAVLNASGVLATSVVNAATTGASTVILAKANALIDDARLALTTAGDIPYSDGTDLQRLAIGAQDTVLMSNTTAPVYGQPKLEKMVIDPELVIYGLYGWTSVVSSATITLGTPVSTWSGMDTDTDYGSLHTTANLDASLNFTFDARISVGSLTSVSDYRWGYGTAVTSIDTTANTVRAVFEAEGGVVYATTASGSGKEQTNITGLVTLTNTNIFKIVRVSNTITYYVNGTVVATHTTNMPTSSANRVLFMASRSGVGGTDPTMTLWSNVVIRQSYT